MNINYHPVPGHPVSGHPVSGLPSTTIQSTAIRSAPIEPAGLRSIGAAQSGAGRPVVAPQGASSESNRLLALATDLYAAWGTLTTTASARRQSDTAAGTGTLAGARTFGAAVAREAEALATANPWLSVLAQGLTFERGSLTFDPDVLGAAGQSYLYRIAEHELGQTFARSFGLTAGEAGGAAAASVTAGAGSGTSAPLGSSGSLLGAAGAALAAYDMFKGWGRSTPATGAAQGAAMGAYIGSVVPGVGTLIGAGVGAILGGLIGCISAGKHRDQIARDQVRELLQRSGVIDAGYGLPLADGSRYDIGRDGGFRLQSQDGTTRRAFEVDFSHPLAREVVGLANPLAALLSGGDRKVQSDFAGYFTNAALSNARTFEEAAANMRAILAAFRLPPAEIIPALEVAASRGALTTDELAAYRHGVAILLPSPPRA